MTRGPPGIPDPPPEFGHFFAERAVGPWNGVCQQTRPVSPPADPTTPEPRPRVLLVDDDPDIAQILGLVLRRDGYEVRIAHDADQAWRELSPEIDLVLLDIMLPGENGPEVLRRM